MFSSLRRIPRLVGNASVQTRNFQLISKPKQQLSVAETWVHALLIATGIFAIPVWVLTHVTEYRGIDKKKEE